MHNRSMPTLDPICWIRPKKRLARGPRRVSLPRLPSQDLKGTKANKGSRKPRKRQSSPRGSSEPGCFPVPALRFSRKRFNPTGLPPE
ncbi:UNVERIFIED_CONTAM: hypothetical protein K2H54_023790 [Gekko kuhli]